MISMEAAKAAILDRVSIYDVVGETVALQSRSGLKVGRCPFHDEKSASFTVYPDHYYCFGCRENGDIITFVRKIQGLGFIDALKYLAPKANLNPADFDNRPNQKQRSAEAALFKAMVAAQRYFASNLNSDRGNKAVEYLRLRGFSDANISDFGFGLAFDQPRGLLDELVKHGFSEGLIESCSLASRSQKNNKLYDFFRERLTVPIHDQFGRLIGFGGRALASDQMPKYKNSRESPLFDKSVTLFGFHKAKDEIRKGHPAIVCEGYMDVLQLWQNGLTGAVACMGTALKQAHLKKLSHMTNRVYLVLDGDQAGKQGSLSAISAALDVPKLEVRVVTLPPNEDPDSFVRAQGPEALRDLLQSAQTLLDFGIRAKLAQAGDTGIPDLLRKEILPWLMRESDNLRQAFLLNRLAQLTGIARSYLEQELEQMVLNHKHSRWEKARVAEPVIEPPLVAQRKPLSNLEYELIGHLFYAQPNEVNSSELRQFTSRELSLDELWGDFLEEILKALEDGICPADMDRSLWVAATDPKALTLVQQLDRQRPAFAVADRTRKIQRLRHEMTLGLHRATISKLKEKMAGATTEDQLGLIKAIQEINGSIKTIENSLK